MDDAEVTNESFRSEPEGPLESYIYIHVVISIIFSLYLATKNVIDVCVIPKPNIKLKLEDIDFGRFRFGITLASTPNLNLTLYRCSHQCVG